MHVRYNLMFIRAVRAYVQARRTKSGAKVRFFSHIRKHYRNYFANNAIFAKFSLQNDGFRTSDVRR